MLNLRRPRTFGVLAISLTTLAAAIALSTAVLLDVLHERTVGDLERSIAGTSAILADQADRAFQAIELVQEAVVEEIRNAEVADDGQLASFAGTFAIHQNLRSRTAALPQVNAVTIVDGTGKLLNFTRYWPIPHVNISDRDYFKALAADASIQRFVGVPVQNRGDGAWTMFIARRLSAADGRFLGLVLGAVELGYFEGLYARNVPGDDAVISMFRNDGTLVVRHPAIGGTIGRIFPTAGASLIAARNAAGGVVRTTSPVDGRDRLIATQSLAHFPLILSVSRATDAVLAPWRQLAAAVVAAALLLEAGLATLFVIHVRQTRAQQKLAQAEAAQVAAEERAKGERYLRDQYARFGIALDNMTQGLCLFDRDDTLIVMNARFAQMHDVPVLLAREGTPLRALLVHLNGRDPRAGLGAVSPLVEACELTSRQGAALVRTCDLADGRAIGIVHEPIPGGGWVCTHEDVTDRRRNEERIVHMARHDGLTGLPNRFHLKERLEESLAQRSEGVGTTVLCLDLDGFKVVNDTHGHQAGDELLCAVAARFESILADGDFVARHGGDEFAVVMTGSAEPDDASRLAERLVEVLHAPFEIQGNEVAIGTSIGVAIADGSSVTTATLLRQADVALYQAKAAGRGTWRFFDSAMDAAIRRRRQLGTDLRSALADGQLDLHYQPLVDARSLAIRGFEALLRWRHPVHGFVGPGEFVPIAEEMGLIRALGAWALKRACSDAARWPENVKVAVNLSPVQFVGGDLVEEVETALRESGLSAGRLELEITESVLLQDNEATLASLHRLRGLGVRISMDDFGTGYSSLGYLRRFPVDKIKIDQSFVRSLGQEPGSIEIVRAVVGLGNALGMSVLAEGVETAEQLAILEREGCDELQGYLFGRPRPLDEANALLESRAADGGPAARAVAEAA